MTFKFLPKVMQFHHIPDCKYENCPTREEYKMERLGKHKNPSPPTEGPIAVAFDPVWLNSSDDLFAGDNIVGIFKTQDGMDVCVYKWKRNNTRKIVAYAPCQEWEWDSMVEGGVHILKPIPKE